MSILRRGFGSDGTEKFCGQHNQTISWISVLDALYVEKYSFWDSDCNLNFFHSCFPMVPTKLVSF